MSRLTSRNAIREHIAAGSLDRVLTIQRAVETLDEYGAASEEWSTIGTVRARLESSDRIEVVADSGAVEATRHELTFVVRWFADLRLTDQILYEGAPYSIWKIREIGRRRGLEIQARLRGSQ
jgi:head-tail adaptor